MSNQAQIDKDLIMLENYFSNNSDVRLFNATDEFLSYELITDFCFSKSNEKDFNAFGLSIVSICPLVDEITQKAQLKIKFHRDLSPKSFTLKTKESFILITDGIPRLSFDNLDDAKAYKKKGIYDNTTIVKVFSGCEFIEVKP